MTASTESLQFYASEQVTVNPSKLLDITDFSAGKITRPRMSQARIYLENDAQAEAVVKETSGPNPVVESPSIIEIKLDEYPPLTSSSNVSLQRHFTDQHSRSELYKRNNPAFSTGLIKSTYDLSGVGNGNKKTYKAKDTSLNNASLAVEKISLQRSYSDVQQHVRARHAPGSQVSSSGSNRLLSHQMGRSKAPGTPQRKLSFSNINRNNVIQKASKDYLDMLNVGSKTIHLRDQDKLEDQFLGQEYSRSLVGQLKDHPLPEVFSGDDRTTAKLAKNSYAGSQSTSTLSQGPSSYHGHGPGSVSSSHDCSSHDWLTSGNTTERSSSYSLNEDDIDKNASEQVKNLFDTIDNYMYLSTKDDYHAPEPKNIMTECNEWMTQFPHLRVVGQQLLVPQETGIEYVGSPSQSPATTSTQISHMIASPVSLNPSEFSPVKGGSSDLTVTGYHVDTTKSGSSLAASLAVTSETEDEEILESDGHIEDVIALDVSAHDEEAKSSVTRAKARLRSGLPPMTPQACVRDNLHAMTFDIIWKQFVHWLKPVHQQIIHPGHDVSMSDGEITPKQQDSSSGSSPQSDVDVPQFILPPSRDSSREDSHLHVQMVQIHPSMLMTMTPRAHTYDEIYHKGNPGDKTSRLLLNSSMLQQQQNKGPPSPLTSLLTVSMAPMIKKAGLPEPEIKQNTQARFSSASRGRGFRGPAGRLQPLEPAKTPNLDERQGTDLDVRGVKLGTPTDHLPLGAVQNIAQFHTGRNGQLPPLDREMSDVLQREKKKPSTSHRASSAVQDDDRVFSTTITAHLPQRSNVASTQGTTDSRPNTTHAYRSEPFNKRSGTPSAFQNRNSGLDVFTRIRGNSLRSPLLPRTPPVGAPPPALSLVPWMPHRESSPLKIQIEVPRSVRRYSDHSVQKRRERP